jgi:hypothetical protein
MDRLDNEDIGVIWARHYPRRAESPASKSLCITLAMIIKQRASIFPEDTDQLQRALAVTGVPREQFDSVDADLNSIKKSD